MSVHLNWLRNAKKLSGRRLSRPGCVTRVRAGRSVSTVRTRSRRGAARRSPALSAAPIARAYRRRFMADLSDIELEELPDLLAHISPDERDVWWEVTAGVKAELGEAALSEWDSRSHASDQYKPGDARSLWKSCKSGTSEIGTVIQLATYLWLR